MIINIIFYWYSLLGIGIPYWLLLFLNVTAVVYMSILCVEDRRAPRREPKVAVPQRHARRRQVEDPREARREPRVALPQCHARRRQVEDPQAARRYPRVAVPQRHARRRQVANPASVRREHKAAVAQCIGLPPRVIQLVSAARGVLIQRWEMMLALCALRTTPMHVLHQADIILSAWAVLKP